MSRGIAALLSTVSAIVADLCFSSHLTILVFPLIVDRHVVLAAIAGVVVLAVVAGTSRIYWTGDPFVSATCLGEQTGSWDKHGRDQEKRQP